MLQDVEAARQDALGKVDGHASRTTSKAAFQPSFKPVQHLPHDTGHACENEDVLHLKARRAADWILDQPCPFRRHRHPQTSLVQIVLAVVIQKDTVCLRMKCVFQSESRRHTLRCDVVMGRPDTTGCENVVKAAPDLVQGRDDGIGNIGDDPCLRQADAILIEFLGYMSEVFVLRAPRENLIADDDQACRDHSLRHRNLSLAFTCR